ncbi:hypothetical protein G6F50_017601 [Rhizopus delemar]|uniref:Uncharacterized protein n=1 Tax=Rhizopus delemar TaxID=936053 RepID=A0A9P6XPV1_9FUNG|nr:hypothetical protein G6F50_017601 [Rhizopus delemar]
MGGAGGALCSRDHPTGVQRQYRGHYRAGAPVAFGERQRRVDAEGFGHRRQRAQRQGAAGGWRPAGPACCARPRLRRPAHRRPVPGAAVPVPSPKPVRR